MTQERRYSEEEIAAIFKRASHDQEQKQRQTETGVGLTLAELQVIGTETGIDASLISKAAANIEDGLSELLPSTFLAPSTFLGIQTGVARTVELHGPLSDDDWDRLVLEMREMFHAHGKTDRDGSIRSWRNGNLRISVERTSTGDRLRMLTEKGAAAASILITLAISMVALVVLLSMIFGSGTSVAGLATFLLFTAIGIAAPGFNAFTLPRWAKKRTHQMDILAEHARGFVGSARMRDLQQAPVSSGTVDFEPAKAPDENVLTEKDAGTKKILDLDLLENADDESQSVKSLQDRNLT